MGVESRKTPADVLKWALIALLLLTTCLGDYFYASHDYALRMVIWFVVVAITLGLAMMTTQGARFRHFGRESRVELRKVVWPNRQETIQTTLLIGTVVLVVAVLLWGVDSMLVWFMSKITV